MMSPLQRALQNLAGPIAAMGHGDARDMRGVLGAHAMGRQVLILTSVGDEASHVTLEGNRQMVRCGETPVYAWLGDRGSLPTHYRLDWSDRDGRQYQRVDPYSFGPGLPDIRFPDFWLGPRYGGDQLGANADEQDGVAGTRFSVWAPRALGVRLTLPGCALPLYPHPATGVWSLFVPGVPDGSLYGFELVRPDGTRIWRSDPYGRAYEPRPGWRARVLGRRSQTFSDQDWIKARSSRTPSGPLSIYEVHLGSFLRRPAEAASYAALADRLVQHVLPLGFTHIECLPVTEHPFEGSWGYQTTGYHAPTYRHGSPDDFRGFVDRLHRVGLGLILDWVPGHFASDEAALANFDGAPLYEYADPVHGRHQGWGTCVFDLTRPEVRAFLISSARRFLSEFHVDGLRIDAVAALLYRDYDRADAPWTPNALGGREDLAGIAFLQELTTTLHREFPGVILIAEDSSLFPGVTHSVDAGGLGFDYKWNLGWMHDSLRYFQEDPIFRRHHHHVLPSIPAYSRAERGMLALSHDEVVHEKRSIYGRMWGDIWQKMANLRLLLAWQWTHPGAKLLFMGTELANPVEWNHETPLPWERLNLPDVQGILRLIGDLNRLYRSYPALQACSTNVESLRYVSKEDDLRSLYVFERRHDSHRVVVILNATPVPREAHVIGLPLPGDWTEILNTDSKHYGGSDVGNLGTVTAGQDPAMGEPYSATIRLPPLGAVVLVPPSTDPMADPNPAPEELPMRY